MRTLARVFEADGEIFHRLAGNGCHVQSERSDFSRLANLGGQINRLQAGVVVIGGEG